jgi:uncharacterized protein (DUF1330 family)
MTAYLIVDTLLTDPALYEEYKLKAKPIAESFGGVYLARGGAMNVREAALWHPTRMVLIQFPDTHAANRFCDSPQYQAILPLSQGSALRTMFVLEGM